MTGSRSKVPRTANTLDLSIIIVNWNVKSYLRQCLTSIYENAKELNFEVIVVDNASCDDSVEMVRREFTSAILISNRENRGFNAANNQGITIAKGRNIMLLNPDTVVLDDTFLEGMVNLLDRRKEIGAVGPKLLGADRKTVQLACARTETNLWSVLTDRAVERRIYNSKWYREKYYNVDRYVATLSGACMMFKREVVGKIGLMDDQFFMYLDDVDYCKRIRNAGWKVYYAPHLKIVHFGGESSARNIERVRAEIHRSLKKYFVKHFGPITVFLLDLIMVLKLTSVVGFKTVRCLFLKERGKVLEEIKHTWALIVDVYVKD